MTLSPIARKFVLHWGEMGTRWGVNRTVAQIHALLYLAPEPLDAETLSATLGVARSNVSTSLRELQAWGIVRVAHVLGDRRDRFATQADVWELFRLILEERKRREVDPTLELLRECVAEAKKEGKEAEFVRGRLAQMLDFFETMTAWYLQISKLPTAAAVRFVKLGGKIHRALGLVS